MISINTYLNLLIWVKDLFDIINISPYTKINRFESFAPLRPNNSVKTYISGQYYFSDLADAMEQSKENIYITNWFMTPEYYLKRPIEKYQDYRLDRILYRAACRGVKINILLYCSIELAFNHEAIYNKKVLEKLHPNIYVNLHPFGSITFWSHHEKLVVLDQQVAFMGGLDICVGRWDFEDCTNNVCEPFPGETYFPGKDYNNSIRIDYKDLQNVSVCLFDKNSEPRMPWRDIAVRLQGKVVVDLTRHFISYWNFARNAKNNSVVTKVYNSTEHDLDNDVSISSEEEEIKKKFFKSYSLTQLKDKMKSTIKEKYRKTFVNNRKAKTKYAKPLISDKAIKPQLN